MSYKPSIGDKVFLRSNEPDQPLVIGKVVKLETFGGKCSTPIAVVQDEKTGQNYMGGYVHPYEANLHSDLEKLRHIEQWNYLMAGNFNGFQIPEKYGVKYKTFE